MEWTFPLEFVEVVWGDGKKTDRQIISATDLPAFGKHHFQIPFDADRQEVGALCGVGFGRQRRDGAADQAVERDRRRRGGALSAQRGVMLMKLSWFGFAFAAGAGCRCAASRFAPTLYAQTAMCNLSGYKAAPGLTAAVAGDALALTWDGDANQEVRLQLTINSGTPTIKDLAVRRKGGTWATVASNLTPEYRVVSGWRRMDQEAYPELVAEFGKVDQAMLDKYKWDAFWDAPLSVPGGEVAHGGATPPLAGIPGTNQPGLPRKPEEVKRATATFRPQGCDVKTDGGRIEVSFPGVEMGIFAGRLQYTVYKGTNLIRQEVIAKTDEQSVAYKYDAGLKGLAIQPASRVVWRDTSNNWQENALESAVNTNPAVAVAANRLLAIQTGTGSLAVFPPPHSFFWVREIPLNLGYNWFRKDSASSYLDRHPAGRERSRPGVWRTWRRRHAPEFRALQRAARHLAADADVPAGRSRHGETGVDAGARLHPEGSLQAAAGISRDGAALPHEPRVAAAWKRRARQRARRFPARADGGRQRLRARRRRRYRRRPARRRSARGNRQPQADAPPQPADDMPAEGPGAVLRDGEAPGAEGLLRPADRGDLQHRRLEGATRRPQRFAAVAPGLLRQPARRGAAAASRTHPTYGQVYHLGSPADLVEMAHRENMVFFMPHPNTKSSAGYPEFIKDKPFFKDPRVRRRRLPLGHGPRSFREAPVRLPVHDGVRRDEQLDGRPADHRRST